MSKFSKSKVPSLGMTKKKNVFNANLPKFDISSLTMKEIDRGAYGSVSVTAYNNMRVVVKQLHPNLATNNNYLSTFNKEASLLHSLDHVGIVKLIGVCEDPVSIMMELCEFSLIPFARNESFHSLDRLLDYFDREQLFGHFPGLGQNIALQITKAITYMHSIDMVHRDIKPANILVSNLHYVDEPDFSEIFESSPIICKIGDLGESRSVVIQTKKMTENARTRYVDRGSTAFMAPEIVLESQKLQTVGIEELKVIDVWALVLTFWVILNPDQRWPFYHELKGPDNTIESLLEKRAIPSTSENYEKMQSCEMALLRDVFYSSLVYDPKCRKSAYDISVLLDVAESIQIHPLSISQATALEKNDEQLAKCINAVDANLVSALPEHDGTNSCAFLSLGLIDMLMGKNLSHKEPSELQEDVEDVITTFPLLFNTSRDVDKLYDVDEAYKILHAKKFLRHNFVFAEDYLNKYNTFKYGCQMQIDKTFRKLIQTAKDLDQSMFAIFHADKYIFSLAFTSAGEIFIFETHPISEDCGGNGNGVIVKFSHVIEGLEWIFTRLHLSSVDVSSKAYVIEVVKDVSRENESDQSDEYIVLSVDDEEEIIEIFSSAEEDIIYDEESDNDDSTVKMVSSDHNIFTKYAWENVEAVKVPCIPYDINGLVHYIVQNPDRKQLLRACRDGRKWLKDSTTNWSGFSSVRYKDCKGGYVCPNFICEITIGHKNYFHFKNGLCVACGATAEKLTCHARKYTAYTGNQAHIFHKGDHQCQSVPFKEDVSNVVRVALAADPFSKPATIQTANILNAIRSRVPAAELLNIVKAVTDRKNISNEMIKVRKELEPAGSHFDGVRNLKEYIDQIDKYMIHQMDEERNIVFKSSAIKLQMAKEMSTMSTTGVEEMSLRNEYCCFDGQRNRVKGYVTLTASVYHPILRKQIPLATMESIHEDTDAVEYFWRTFNGAYKECNNVEDKFNPLGWISDLAGANFNGLAKIYGDDIMDKIKGCEFHYKQSVHKHSRSLNEEVGPRFNKLADDLLQSLTPEAFEATAAEFSEFIQTLTDGDLNDWFKWWMDRKEYVFRAFRGFSEPRMNQAEVIHAGRVHRDRSGVSLMDSCYFDVRDSLLLITEVEGFKNGTFSGGCGPTAAERFLKNWNVEMEASERLGQDILIHGVGLEKRKIKPDDGFKPPPKKSRKRRTAQMIKNRITKAEELHHNIKITDVKLLSPLKRVYSVKNSVSAKLLNKVEICLTPTCSCKDFDKNKDDLNCVHIIFVMMYALQCNDSAIFLKKNISEAELDLLFQCAPDEVPAELMTINKPKVIDFNKRQQLLRQHELYGTQQDAELQVKSVKPATCRACKRKLEIDDVCLKVFKVLLIPYTSDKPTTQNVYFCPKRACFTRCPSYMYLNIHDSIPCAASITDEQFQSFPDDINARR